MKKKRRVDSDDCITGRASQSNYKIIFFFFIKGIVPLLSPLLLLLLLLFTSCSLVGDRSSH